MRLVNNNVLPNIGIIKYHSTKNVREPDMLDTPILFLVFNRPGPTHEVFTSIKKAKPSKIYIAADGPRDYKEGDAQKCSEVKRIVTNIDWPCKVKFLFREQNLGCKLAVSSAIDWFFSQEEEGIILEDDCLPDSTFFAYCATLLEYYRHDKRIMHISGVNFLFGKYKTINSYSYSKYPLIWGWATWKRAWQNYNVEMDGYNFEQIKRKFNSRWEREYWIEKFDLTYQGKIDTWDYQWVYTIFGNDGVCVNPKINLVSNIGFGEGATHTKVLSKLSNLPKGQIETFDHPKKININVRSDNYLFFSVFTNKSPKKLLRFYRNTLDKLKYSLKQYRVIS